MNDRVELSRRTLLATGAAAPVAGAGLPAAARPDDEAYWRKVAALFDAPPPGVIQLENGQFGAMARATRAAYEGYVARINRETTLYTRRGIGADLAAVRAKAAALLGVGEDEIAFTRGGTESMQTLIGQYNRLKPGDAVLYADLDYDSMQVGMAALARTRGVRVVKIDLPEPTSRSSLIEAYDAALKANPDVRLMLLTHLSHRTGLIPPVKEITAMARARGVDVLLDCGHALGQTEFSLKEMGVEFAGLNLHKWIGAPLGVGLVYIARDRIPDIDVSPLEEPSPKIDARVHTGTVNYAAVLAVSDAIATHEHIGPAAKAARLRWLRDRWAEAARDIPGVEVLTPNDPALHAGITSFRVAGRTTTADNVAIRKALFERHRIFTVERSGPAKGACVRVTPSFVNGPADVDALVTALRELARP
ncbi:aminotransferase class V-fold PLP-dependent enzyme [Phenylobacterium kunshanense]|uniref:Aminotransferase n=1 Tax=Phenylobacterium kunshanense TaxID=1445034 RepID=A0A328B9X0_9CAUL|nr:aminotransferase class V-fold PLP-dependent enzyme [Phenylobacterium kunshanense]RAK62514.1 aminotransferase [Phenylobacterium kunshanense]